MKVDDIRPDALMEGQHHAMMKDVEFLAERKQQFVSVSCPACASRNCALIYEKYGMDHQRCLDCDTQYVSPRPGAELLGQFYAQSENYAYWAKYIFPASEKSRRESIFRPRAELVKTICSERSLRGGTLLEVGAGSGLFCEEILARSLFDRVIGLEPTPDLAQTCRDRGVEVIELPFEQVELDHSIDFVAAFEVIEHLFDPFDFVRWAHGMLKPGGHVLISCPNIRGLDTILLGRDAAAVDHEHLNYFHPASMKLMLERAGFHSIEISTPGKLDVDLIQRARLNGTVSDDALGPILPLILDSDDPMAGVELQSAIRRAKLSSHLMAVAVK